MDALEGWRPVGDTLYVFAAAIAGPLAAAGLTYWDAELAWIEVGLAQQELEAEGGEVDGVAGKPGAQRGKGGRAVVVHGARE